MNTFSDLVKEKLREISDVFLLEDLLSKDQNELRAEYIRENPDIVTDIVCDVFTSLAPHMASLAVSVESCDVFALAEDLRTAILANPELESCIDGEIDRERRLNEQFAEIEG